MTIIIVTVTIIINRYTLLISVEEPSVRAFKAYLVVPVPHTTADIRWTGIIEVREDTSAVFQVIALVTGSAVSVFTVRLALIRDRNANFISVEGPVL